MVWIGDSSSHDPSAGHSLAQVISALQAAEIRVIALDVGPTPGQISNGLNSAGQASAVANATGGTLLSTTDPSQVSNLILAGLQNLPVTVTHTVGPCDPSLAVNLTPPSQSLTSGEDASFPSRSPSPRERRRGPRSRARSSSC